MKNPSPTQLDQWVQQFYRDGFIVIPEVLKKRHVQKLKEDIDRIAKRRGSGKSRDAYIYKRLFEESDAALGLFNQEPIVTFAEQVFNDPLCKPGDDNFSGTSLQCHVIHNNAIIVPPKKQGINKWHQDDPPHFVVTDGEPPTNIHLPPLVFTVNYYLTDVRKPENGPTVAIKGSHLWGKACPVDLDEDQYDLTHGCGPAGSAVIFNCQVWHRGSPNTSSNTRYVAQVTYGRRIIGHKYSPFMNYQMPQHVVDRVNQDKRLKRLAGFLHGGAYG